MKVEIEGDWVDEIRSGLAMYLQEYQSEKAEAALKFLDNWAVKRHIKFIEYVQKECFG